MLLGIQQLGVDLPQKKGAQKGPALPTSLGQQDWSAQQSTSLSKFQCCCLAALLAHHLAESEAAAAAAVGLGPEAGAGPNHFPAAVPQAFRLKRSPAFLGN